MKRHVVLSLLLYLIAVESKLSRRFKRQTIPSQHIKVSFLWAILKNGKTITKTACIIFEFQEKSTDCGGSVKNHLYGFKMTKCHNKTLKMWSSAWGEIVKNHSYYPKIIENQKKTFQKIFEMFLFTVKNDNYSVFTNHNFESGPKKCFSFIFYNVILFQ